MEKNTFKLLRIGLDTEFRSIHGSGYVWLKLQDNDRYETTATRLYGPQGLVSDLTALQGKYSYVNYLTTDPDGRPMFYGSRAAAGSAYGNVYDVLDADGKAIIEEKEIRIPMFKVVSVFDVSQTAGKPLPQLAADLSGNVQQYEVFMEALRRASPVPMEIKPVARDTDGFFSIKAQSITIRAGMSEVQTVCAAVHEIAHAKLHDYEHMTELADDGETILVPGEKSRNTEEVEAESISYAVCKYYGIETGENSFGYIATWSKGKELKELRASLETINKTASELITDIDRHFADICKERGINHEEVNATQTDEALYLVDGSVYLHVQHTDGGWDYSLYDKESKKLLDGGVIDSSAIEDSPVASVAGAVRTEVFAIQGMTPTKVTFADMKILEDLSLIHISEPTRH